MPDKILLEKEPKAGTQVSSAPHVNQTEETAILSSAAASTATHHAATAGNFTDAGNEVCTPGQQTSAWRDFGDGCQGTKVPGGTAPTR